MLYWVTDANPVRKEQIDSFHRWQVKNGHQSKPGQPKVILKLDTANRDPSKMIIQGVSGVGSDIMDLMSGADVRYFESMGLLRDVSDDAKRLGFSLDKTFKSVGPELSVPKAGTHRQYAYPCNVTTSLFWINRTVFKKYGFPLPTDQWTWTDFEHLGVQIRDASLAAGGPKIYMGARPEIVSLIRSFGLSLFNETGSACRLHHPQYVKALNTLRRWTDELGIIPNKADMASFDVQGGFGGVELQLFKNGQFATFTIGRWGLIGMRRGAAMDLAVVYPPHDVIKTSTIMTRCAGIYQGSRHPQLAQLFLSYLASETYSDTIIKNADALPPNPDFLQKESYLRPSGYSNEWGCHEVFSRAADEIAVPPSHSPFISYDVAMRIITKWQDKFEVGICSAEEAAQNTELEINGEIQRTLKELPKLKGTYQQLAQEQKQIDIARHSGQKVSTKLVRNPYYRFHGIKTGWIQD